MRTRGASSSTSDSTERVLNQPAAVISVNRRCRSYFGRFTTTLNSRLFQQNRPFSAVPDRRFRCLKLTPQRHFVTASCCIAKGLFDHLVSDREQLSGALFHECEMARSSVPNHPPSPFQCPGCGARYKVVRLEAPLEPSLDREFVITCKNCGGPLDGRVGKLILKYFLVGRPHSAQR